MKPFPFPISWPIAYIAFWWWITETLYFGMNWKSDSPLELAADGLVFLLMAMAFAFGTERRPRLGVHRILGRDRKQVAVYVTVEGDVEIKQYEHLQA